MHAWVQQYYFTNENYCAHMISALDRKRHCAVDSYEKHLQNIVYGLLKSSLTAV